MPSAICTCTPSPARRSTVPSPAPHRKAPSQTTENPNRRIAPPPEKQIPGTQSPITPTRGPDHQPAAHRTDPETPQPSPGKAGSPDQAKQRNTPGHSPAPTTQGKYARQAGTGDPHKRDRQSKPPRPNPGQCAQTTQGGATARTRKKRGDTRGKRRGGGHRQSATEGDDHAVRGGVADRVRAIGRKRRTSAWLSGVT